MNKTIIPDNLYKRIISLIPICCVDVIILIDDSFLLVKRSENPAKNKWWFPGGRILFNEDLKEAVKRKIKEELNIKNIKRIKFLGVKETKFKKGKFGKPVHTINCVFSAFIKKKEIKNIRSNGSFLKYKLFKNIQKKFNPYIKKFLKLSGFK